MKPKVTLI